MDQLIDNQEAWALWYNDNADSSVDEIDGDPVEKNWGIRECMIVLIFLLLFFIIFRKKDGEENESNEADGSSSQPAETTVSSVDKKKLEEEKREMILNLFRSQQNQQKITIDHLRTSTNKSCGTIDTSNSSTSGESQRTIDCQRCDDDSAEFSLDEEEGLGVVVLSNLSNVQTDDDNHPRSVSNLCAICLEEYHEGETIVWSSNKNCQHAFHRECLVNYLVKVKAEKEFPCPCCRRNFFFENAEAGNDESDE